MPEDGAAACGPAGGQAAGRMREAWPVLRLLGSYSWQELRHHGARHALAVVAVALGVALAFAVHLIHRSALAEFEAAVQAINGQADLVLRSARGGLDEQLFPRLLQHPDVEVASPVVDLRTQSGDQALRVLGLDPLLVRQLAPRLLPQVSRDVIGNERLTLFDPRVIFLNPAAQRALQVVPGTEITLQAGLQPVRLRVAGTVEAGGEPLGVMDIAGAQDAFGMLGRISRLDIRLREGLEAEAVLRRLDLPDGVLHDSPRQATAQALDLSQAYRMNLGVLSLIALFTGAYLVYSTLSLSVVRRQQQFALLGVLGLPASERLQLVLLESLVLGGLGALLGLGLGLGLASWGLAALGGDLGAAYFPGAQGGGTRLQASAGAAALYGGVGVLAAVWGGLLPARSAQRLAPAQALKGPATTPHRGPRVWLGPALLLAGGGLALLPPLGGLPLAAYLAIACFVVGSIECVPAAVGSLLGVWTRLLPRRLLQRHAVGLLAIERVRHMRQAATVAIAGVVVSLGLSIALTVMVGSFRGSISHWLDALLPADLYARTSQSLGGNDVLHLDVALVQTVARLPGVAQAMGVRVTTLALAAHRPPVVLIARPTGEPGPRRPDDPADPQAAEPGDPSTGLPLVGRPVAAEPGRIGVYASEIAAELYDLRPGSRLDLALRDGQPPVPAQVRGLWRDYAHQQGALIVDAADYQRHSGDTTVNDLALWLQPGAQASAVQEAIRQAAAARGWDGGLLSFQEPREIRLATFQVFDRSFAVAGWLQAVALGIGLFGLSASLSAQMLARRKELGLLVHLGFTRRQLLAMLAGEGAVLSTIGSLLGLALGLAVSVVLVHVVNPQSFHWRMDLQLPAARLAALCAGLVAAGTLTAWAAASAAATSDVVQAVKEDW